MSELVVIAYDKESDATGARDRFRDIEKAGQVRIEDSAVVSKDSSGKLEIKNPMSGGTKTGAVIGGAIGLILPVLGPVVGTVGGAVAGGWIGSKISPSVDKDFVEEVAHDLEPGKSALFLIIRNWNPDAVVAAAAEHYGEIHHTTLPEGLVTSLEQALKRPS